MPADVIKRVNHMARKTHPGIIFADRHNVCDIIPNIPPEREPNSTLPVATTMAVNVLFNDDTSTDDDYDPQANDNDASNFSIDNTIVFDADFTNHNGDDEIIEVDQNNNDNNLFPIHAANDIDGIPGVDIPEVDIPGMEGEVDDGVDDIPIVDIPGVPNPRDSDSDSKDNEHHSIRTMSGRAVHSTQDPEYVYTTIGSNTSFLQRSKSLRSIIPVIKPNL